MWWDGLLDKQLYAGLRGDFQEGLRLAKEMEFIRPGDPRASFNRGWYEMMDGNLLKGNQLMDEGRPINVFGQPPIPTPRPIYNNEPLNGEYIVLRSEGGFGDEIINVRFAKDIFKKGGKPIVTCHPDLAPIFARMSEVCCVCSEQALQMTYFDYWIPAMSAISSLKIEYKNLYNKPYLTAKNNDYLSNFINKKSNNKLKVGIRFRGNPQFEHQQYRMFPPEFMMKATENPNIQRFSLQKDPKELPKIQLPNDVIDMEPMMNCWEDTFSIINEMDLVITSCTAVAHAAGSLGIPTWIVVPVLPYYIWAKPGNKSPWYKSITLFRQKRFDSWSDPFNQVKKNIQKLC